MRENQGWYYDFHKRETQIGNVAEKDLNNQRTRIRKSPRVRNHDTPLYGPQAHTMRTTTLLVVRYNGLKVSYEAVLKRLQAYDAVLITQINRKETLKPSSRKYMVNKQDTDILAQYNLELRGFYNYYSIADNIGHLRWKFNCFMKYSMLKTLGLKHKTTV